MRVIMVIYLIKTNKIDHLAGVKTAHPPHLVIYPVRGGSRPTRLPEGPEKPVPGQINICFDRFPKNSKNIKN